MRVAGQRGWAALVLLLGVGGAGGAGGAGGGAGPVLLCRWMERNGSEATTWWDGTKVDSGDGNTQKRSDCFVEQSVDGDCILSYRERRTPLGLFFS